MRYGWVRSELGDWLIVNMSLSVTRVVLDIRGVEISVSELG